MKTLLLEIGTEEIPAGYIEPALAALSSTLAQKLDEARVAHGAVRTFGTPRRLAVRVDEVALRQTSLTSEVLGPPRRAAYDTEGRPTIAAVKFAEKVGVPLGKLTVVATPKGEYLNAVVTAAGVATPTVLKTILPAAILATPFPKSMRWADLAISFARPIVWILALFGTRSVTFDVGNIRSGCNSMGHRFMHPKKIRIAEPSAYASALQSGFVVVDAVERRKLIANQADQAAATAGGSVLPDADLLDINTYLVEYPAVAIGRFADEFLELPAEVLITAMREHQKYFAVTDTTGALLPRFIAVNNTPVKDMAVVVRGHERVLRARLEDAKFFYRSDKAVPLDRQVEKLRNVLFQAQLGSVYDKVCRVRALARTVAEQSGGDEVFCGQVERAAWLCKADLVSQVVGEFPKLQGIMGRVYAGVQGEPHLVATAIEEHYRPTASGGALPETLAGAVLAIADKMDTICGCFRAGLIPTGAADPYALRRQGIGVVQIMRQRDFRFPLTAVVNHSLGLFDGSAAAPGDTAAKIMAFIEGRLASILVEEGFAKDTVAAVLGVAMESVPALWQRAHALQQLKDKPDFEPIAVSFKRVVNIIRRAEGFTPGAVEERLLAHPSEFGLLAAYRSINGQVQDDLKRGRYAEALARVATLRPPVDAFFDDVMVMAEDATVRQNRLSLLALVAGLFDTFADFSKLST
ncbi:MAG: glycine--tRNA ligase subunit beta [Desulfobacterales bacterium]|jgi:glycyl-tRNA synthetase beta chain|nr:glycine--tRNA ligase subunit beta [Desulfobacterales bacterium]